MSEEILDQVEPTGNEGGEGTPPTNQNPPAPPVSFDEMLASNKDFRSEFDRRVQQTLQTARGKWEQEQLDNQDEAKKLEKMTQAQRDNYLLQKDKADFERQKKEFQLDQMRVATGNELLKRGLDPSFASYLTADTAEKTTENLNTFEEMFNKAVQKSVNDRMRGNEPPKDNTRNNAVDPFLAGFNGK